MIKQFRRCLAMAAMVSAWVLAAAAQAPIALSVDASQAPLRMLYTHEVISVPALALRPTRARPRPSWRT